MSIKNIYSSKQLEIKVFMFQLSVKSKYGLAAVIELAQKQEKGPIQIKAISGNRNIPQNYLEQVLVELKKGGLVRSFRGINGGYKLQKDPKSISVKDVLTILEGPCKLTEQIATARY